LGQFDDLCRTEGKVSRLAELSDPPQLPSRRSVAIECERLELIRAVLPVHVDWGPITTNRRRQWAAVVRRQTAQAVRRYPPSKRYTLLLAFLSVRREEITDAIVDMFYALIGRVFSHSSHRSFSPQVLRTLSFGSPRAGNEVLPSLERVEVPDEVEAYRASLLEVLRSVDVGLPDLLMEVDHWTGFTSVLTHLTGRRPP